MQQLLEHIESNIEEGLVSNTIAGAGKAATTSAGAIGSLLGSAASMVSKEKRLYDKLVKEVRASKIKLKDDPDNTALKKHVKSMMAARNAAEEKYIFLRQKYKQTGSKAGKSTVVGAGHVALKVTGAAKPAALKLHNHIMSTNSR